jgi:hypothetical protein
MPVVVRGLHELQAALAHADRSLRLGVRKGLRQAAEPVQRGAEELALEKIRRMPRSPQWARMRVGVTRNLVYVAPRQRGIRWNAKNPGYRFQMRRPNLADLLMDRAMQPALDQHQAEVEARFEELLDHISDDFNRGGI